VEVKVEVLETTVGLRRDQDQAQARELPAVEEEILAITNYNEVFI
jgi:hypothetical protein